MLNPPDIVVDIICIKNILVLLKQRRSHFLCLLYSSYSDPMPKGREGK